jgi:hypothetical protein
MRIPLAEGARRNQIAGADIEGAEQGYGREKEGQLNVIEAPS